MIERICCSCGEKWKCSGSCSKKKGRNPLCYCLKCLLSEPDILEVLDYRAWHFPEGTKPEEILLACYPEELKDKASALRVMLREKL